MPIERNKKKEVCFMKKECGRQSKWISGLVLALMMTLLAALPVMAKEYTVDFAAGTDGENSAYMVPNTLNSGDVIKLASDKYDGLRAVVFFQYYDKDGNFVDSTPDEEKTTSATVKTIDGVTEWSVTARQIFKNTMGDDTQQHYSVGFDLRPYNKDIAIEEQHNELPDGTVGKEYSAAWIRFGEDKNIKVTRAIWNGGSGGSKGLNFHFPNTYDGTVSIEGNEICLSGTPKKAGEYPLPYSLELWYTSDKYPDGHKIISYLNKKMKIEEEKKEEEKKEEEEKHEEHHEESSSESSSQPVWNPPASTETPKQQETKQLTSAQTNIASIATLTSENKAALASTGMNLNMTNVNTIDATTANLLAANNSIPYNVTFMCGGQTMVCKIPAGFNYKQFVKADGSINIHEVLWEVFKSQMQQNAKKNTKSKGRR